LRGRRTLSQVFATERRRQMGEVAAARGMAEAAQPTLEEALPRGVVDAPAFYLDSMPAGDDEPALKARRWLLSRVGPLGLWRSLARRRLGKGLPPFEAYRVAQEIHGLNPVLIQAADLPEGRQLAPYLARLLAAPRPLRRPITAEVLNASSLDGLASDIAKILRSRGVDVVDTGNASPRQRTLVYDRSGRPELAAEVRRLLRCPSAEALTKLEPARLIDVTVAVADDCAARE
ncbi:MAG: LytR C-terminal domain-containing protein, partial [Elusimicrobia bacterium]|nr:LytR C-terminal domain-containing protein [Elusimicrobiota bacterium]